MQRAWALIALNGKIPAHKAWQRRPRDRFETIEKWVKKGHNLGLRTGKVSGVIVIDDDSPDGSASKALNLPKTVTVITGSGKKHFYFKYPSGVPIKNSVKTLARDIDVRGSGGQVVFVGSTHPDTGPPLGDTPSPSQAAGAPGTCFYPASSVRMRSLE